MCIFLYNNPIKVQISISREQRLLGNNHNIQLSYKNYVQRKRKFLVILAMGKSKISSFAGNHFRQEKVM